MKHKIRIEIREIERKNYHLFVNLEVDGKECRLLIDTGASKTVFDSERVLNFTKADKIKLHEVKSVGLGVTDMETRVARLKNIKVGKLRIGKMEVAVLPIGHVNVTYSQINLPEIDGVLGSDFLMKYKAVIDYNKAVLRLVK
jgi:predicted aspartyl protease